jgi:type I restriction enzyme R subunit
LAWRLFVRSLVGLDRAAAKAAIAGFLAGKQFKSQQIEFLDMIVNHLTEHGVMGPELLYESPFTDVASTGPDATFTAAQLDELVSVLEQVRAAALAS